MTNEKHFLKTISKWEFDYGLFTNLPRIVNCLFSDFIQTQKRYPIFLDKIHSLTWKLFYQAKIFLVNLTPKELTPYKISQICQCTFKDTRRQTDVKFWPLLSIRKFLVLTWIGPWVEFRNPTLLQGSKVRVKISKWRD